MFLQSLVASADKNGDNGMDFNEFEGFGDFGFVFQYTMSSKKALKIEIIEVIFST